MASFQHSIVLDTIDSILKAFYSILMYEMQLLSLQHLQHRKDCCGNIHNIKPATLLEQTWQGCCQSWVSGRAALHSRYRERIHHRHRLTLDLLDRQLHNGFAHLLNRLPDRA